MCDAAGKDDKIEATPLCLLFGQGHQHFLARLATIPRTDAAPPRGRGKNTVTLSAAETLHEALFEPWLARTQRQPSAGTRPKMCAMLCGPMIHLVKNPPRSTAPIDWQHSVCRS